MTWRLIEAQLDSSEVAAIIAVLCQHCVGARTHVDRTITADDLSISEDGDLVVQHGLRAGSEPATDVLIELVGELLLRVDCPDLALSMLSRPTATGDVAPVSDVAELGMWMQHAFALTDSRSVLRPIAWRMAGTRSRCAGTWRTKHRHRARSRATVSHRLDTATARPADRDRARTVGRGSVADPLHGAAAERRDQRTGSPCPADLRSDESASGDRALDDGGRGLEGARRAGDGGCPSSCRSRGTATTCGSPAGRAVTGDCSTLTLERLRGATRDTRDRGTRLLPLVRCPGLVGVLSRRPVVAGTARRRKARGGPSTGAGNGPYAGRQPELPRASLARRQLGRLRLRSRGRAGGLCRAARWLGRPACERARLWRRPDLVPRRLAARLRPRRAHPVERLEPVAARRRLGKARARHLVPVQDSSGGRPGSRTATRSLTATRPRSTCWTSRAGAASASILRCPDARCGRQPSRRMAAASSFRSRATARGCSSSRIDRCDGSSPTRQPKSSRGIRAAPASLITAVATGNGASGSRRPRRRHLPGSWDACGPTRRVSELTWMVVVSAFSAFLPLTFLVLVPCELCLEQGFHPSVYSAGSDFPAASRVLTSRACRHCPRYSNPAQLQVTSLPVTTMS